jgi:O-methyltransferase
MKLALHRFLRRLALKSPFRRNFLHNYEYFFWPSELNFLCTELEQSLPAPGIVIEIGCASGATTVFLNKHMDWMQKWALNPHVEAKKYLCLDTFAGFLPSHVEHEQKVRGKSNAFQDYRVNDVSWFREMLLVNDVTRVTPIQTDAAIFDYRQHAPICFALLDVDLYVPTQAALPRIYEVLSPGGVIIVDDCQENQKYDGARQAYLEFMASIGREAEISHRKFGLIRK